MSSAKKGEVLLPDDVLWAEGGHASDVVLTAIADGQASIVPPAVLAHVDRCTTCTTHLGNAALLSLHTARELAALEKARRAEARRPIPRLAVALGLAVAALGLVPSLFDASRLDLHFFFTHDVPLVMRGLQTLGQRVAPPGSSTSLFLTYGIALFLIAIGFSLSRFLPKKETPR